MPTIHLRHGYCDEGLTSIEGHQLTDEHYDTVIAGEDVDVFKPDGTPLLVFRHQVLPADVCNLAWPLLRKVPQWGNSNRTMAAGGRHRRVKRDGTLSRTWYANKVWSSQLGSLERMTRPYAVCRQTAITGKYINEWHTVLPFLQAIDSVFAKELPTRHAAQMAMVERTQPIWTIEGTSFSTMTVNKNWQTKVHKDEGDLPEGFGVMSVLSSGHYQGGYLIFIKYRIAVDMQPGDLLLADVHEYHANSPLKGTGDYERISTVLYYRRDMYRCGTQAEELATWRKRQPGDPLW